jgi:hypothetical protein
MAWTFMSVRSGSTATLRDSQSFPIAVDPGGTAGPKQLDRIKPLFELLPEVQRPSLLG